MPIEKSAFGGIKLTISETKEFINWLENGKPSKEAIQTMRDGEKLVDEFAKNGCVKFYPNR